MAKSKVQLQLPAERLLLLSSNKRYLSVLLYLDNLFLLCPNCLHPKHLTPSNPVPDDFPAAPPADCSLAELPLLGCFSITGSLAASTSMSSPSACIPTLARGHHTLSPCRHLSHGYSLEDQRSSATCIQQDILHLLAFHMSLMPKSKVHLQLPTGRLLLLSCRSGNAISTSYYYYSPCSLLLVVHQLNKFMYQNIECGHMHISTLIDTTNIATKPLTSTPNTLVSACDDIV